MTRIRSVHLIDPDSSRRASIARDLYARAIHAEIYEDSREFVQRVPNTGAVLANDEAQMDANELLEFIRNKASYLPVAMFARSPSPEMIVRAMTSGAISYLEWPFLPDEIDRVVRDMEHTVAHQAAVARKIAQATEAVASLSRREVQVLRVLIDGASNKEIARTLDISPRTVEIHRANMMMKLDARSVADAVRIGIYASVDEPVTYLSEKPVQRTPATAH